MSEADGPTKGNNPANLPKENTDRSLPAQDAGETFDAGDCAAIETVDSPTRGNRTTSETKTIGPYRLVQKLGEGGMGQVWLAEQTAPLQRLVAVKLIRADVADGILLERFESERQVLARMNHPSIAKVFDAGTTPEGAPYFVMEYVPGIPITLYCDKKKLSIRKRIELFAKVCDGVQHAHQKAIIHRDLKPANILIAEVDGQATPRIIDFGIAKAVRERDSIATMITRVGGFIGTPAYMSPEQSDPDIQDVDTRSDVYSLAVILYELLTGTLPFDPTQWRSEVINEGLRRVREQDPPRPSIQYRNRSTMQRDTALITARLRSTEPPELVNVLQGDLDWITMKALERDRERRYGTPSQLAADLERYLHNEPIEARPPSAAYRMRKYAARHRAGVAAAASLVAMLVAFAVVQTVQLRRITRERDRANRITEFMTTMFKVSDPSESRGNSVTAREILDEASKNIATRLVQDPELQADLMATMATTYVELGLYARAQELFGRALEIQRRVLGADNRKTLEVMSWQGWTLQRQGRYVESEKVLSETVERANRALGATDHLTLTTRLRLGVTLEEEGRFVQAEGIERQVLEMEDRVSKPDEDLEIQAKNNLAITLSAEGRLGHAEELEKETLERVRRSNGEDHPLTLKEMNNLSDTLDREGKYAEAENIQSRALETELRVFGPQHPVTLHAMSTLAAIRMDEGHYAEAEKTQRQLVAADRSVLGPDNRATLHDVELLGVTLAYERRFPEAEDIFHDALKVAEKQPGQRIVAGAWYNFACAAAVAGHADEALHYLSEAIHRDYGSAAEIATDGDLKTLRDDPRFVALVAQVRKRDAAKESH